jgi:hypothetical protein
MMHAARSHIRDRSMFARSPTAVRAQGAEDSLSWRGLASRIALRQIDSAPRSRPLSRQHRARPDFRYRQPATWFRT